jgi:hypothetical protein
MRKEQEEKKKECNYITLKKPTVKEHFLNHF